MDATARRAAHLSTPRIWMQEARCEFLRLWRTPAFTVPSLLFPSLFYLLFGVLLARGGDEVGRYLFAGYAVFGVTGVALFGFGVTVALDRSEGLLTLKRAQPMPPGAYLAAKVGMAMLFSLVMFALLSAFAVGLGGVRLAPAGWLGLLAVVVLAVLPMGALGLWLGTLVSGRGAPALINLVYLPMAFLSGLFVPLPMLPEVLRTIAPLWPSYHLARLAQLQVGFAEGVAPWLHLVVLLGVAAVFLFLARRRLATS
ncbi:ABC transporter permease [Pseudoxanthomonas suwonensis]|uniref:ABC transporter permease n=1 Tax=Pseudoxanthomonas suwonensis TaxID=314722 RepID=UPI00048B5E3F|nr:ABC transporter permease [Pseudoxanthomonas suwonensis]